MLRETREGRNDLFGGAAGPADGLKSSRRGFLGGTGLAAIGAAIGGAMPLSGSGEAIPAAAAQGAARRLRRQRRRAEGPAVPEIPRQARRPGPARRSSARCRDAGKPARRRHHAARQVLHPQQRADSRRDEGPRCLEDRHRRLGREQDRDHARRTEEEVSRGDLPHGARMRRQRPLRLLADRARQPVDQRRRGLRRMDRHCSSPMCSKMRSRSLPRSTPRTIRPTCISRATPASRPISRGVRLEKAMEPHTLLVWGMNGQPLPNIHGGPLRLVVPGWAGLGLAEVAHQDHADRQGA